MRRREFLTSLAATAAAQTTRPRPNILVLFSDDQRFDTIRALGNPEIQTPNLDALAARGTAFTHAFIMGGNQPAVCVPSRAMLLSGLSLFHAHNAVVAKPGKTPRPPYALFPEWLGRHGYQTFASGKWHGRTEVFHQAFQSGASIMFGGMDNHYNTPTHDYNPEGVYPKEKARRLPIHSSEVFANAAIEFLKTRDRARPFCAYIAFTAPHDPRQAPPEWVARYDPAKLTLPPNFLPEHPFDNGELKIRDEMLLPFPRRPEAVKKELADYYALISHLDEQVGRIVRQLEASGDRENTLIVFAGDNGLAVGQHGLLGKQNLYEHSIRVPLILAGPGVPAGRRRDDLVYLYDLFPTFCETAGLPKPTPLDGQALFGKAKPRASTFHAYREFQRAVRTHTHKLIRYTVNGQVRRQLFDLRKDPWEKRDLIGEPRYAARAQQLEKLLGEWKKQVDDPQPDA